MSEHADFLNSDAQVLVHLYSCTSKREVGLAREIQEKFPYAKPGTKKRRPGTAKMWGSSKKNERYVLGLFVKAADSDTAEQRASWFSGALDSFYRRLEPKSALESVAFSETALNPRRSGQPGRVRVGGADPSALENLLREWAEKNSVAIEIISLKKTSERLSLNSAPPAQAANKTATQEEKGGEENSSTSEYWESSAYQELDSQLTAWICTETAEWSTIPTDDLEALNKLASHLQSRLANDKPELFAALSKIVPSVYDDLYEILEVNK